MWDKIRRQFDRKNRSGELYYATHHHLIPLYVLVGICLVALLMMSSFVAVMWSNTQRDVNQATASVAIKAVNDLYLPAVVSPTEKKQYVYSAAVRFPITDPYNTFRYSFDPGLAGSRTSSTVVLTTVQTLQEYEAPILAH